MNHIRTAHCNTLHSTFCSPFSSLELSTAISQLSTSTSSGSDQITYPLLTHLPQSALHFLLYIFNLSRSTHTFPSTSSSFEGHPLQARHKQNWGRGFILLLPQTAALPGSDAGSDVIKPASSFVIQNRQTSCSMWCPMYGAHC